MKNYLAKPLPAKDLPMTEEELRELAWKAWTALQKKLASEGVSLMQPSDVEFVRYRGQVVARFYNTSEHLTCFLYDTARQKFKHSAELTEILCQQEFSL
jgi:extradiol dioxygenase family protein